MKNLSLMAVILLSLTLSLASCKKDADKSKTELLTQSSWKQTNSETLIGGSWVSDWSTVDACDKDDLTTFKTDKTYQLTEGASKCDPTDPDLIDTGTWSFNSDETAIIVDGLSAPINALDNNTLVVTSDFGGTSYRSTYGH